MSYAQQRSKSDALQLGTTEGKYFYRRPNTEDPQRRNSEATNAVRDSLNVFDGYTQQEAVAKRSPGSDMG